MEDRQVMGLELAASAWEWEWAALASAWEWAELALAVASVVASAVALVQGYRNLH